MLCILLFVIGVLLDDLIVAEDLAAAETSAASHAVSDVQSERVHAGNAFADERMRYMGTEELDRAVVLGNPVAPPVNGNMHTDISSENAMRLGCR